jgi:hypothetical protein
MQMLIEVPAFYRTIKTTKQRKLLKHSLPVDRAAVESVEGWDGLGVPVGHGRPACRKNSLCQRKNMFIALQENYFSDGKEHLSFDFFY